MEEKISFEVALRKRRLEYLKLPNGRPVLPYVRNHEEDKVERDPLIEHENLELNSVSEGYHTIKTAYYQHVSLDRDPVIVKRGEHESLELVAEVYHQASGGAPTAATILTQGNQSHSSSNILKEFKSPMKNTVLHVTALCGNDDMAYRTVQQEPDLIFSANENKDTPACCCKSCSNNNAAKLLDLMKMKNKQGNIMLHEAMKSGSSSDGTIIFDALEAYTVGEGSSVSLAESCYELALDVVNKEYQSVLYLAVEAGRMEDLNRILDKCPESAMPRGISPFEVAMLKKNKEMLETIVTKKEEWIHLRDPHGAIALHFAARTGYLEGVVYLVERCKTCSIERDEKKNLPIHLAASEGHVEVVKELLEYSLDLNEMLDKGGNNILHIAATSGKLDVVRYILQTPELESMINQRNKVGETPLHVATRNSRARIVYDLTWDHRVIHKLNEVNLNNKTPLDIATTIYNTSKTRNPSLRQSLTRIALESAGAKAPRSAELLGGSSESDDVSGTEWFKDRVDSLSVISTLIVTASVAACLSVPGEAAGEANNLHKAMFQLFIFSITVSLFSSMGATIILIWGRIGMFELLNLSMEVAMPLLGTSLITLSVAFMAGVYTVVSKLTWLATTFVIISSTLVVIIFLLYILLFLPSASTWKISRWISYYPFIFLASLAEKQRVPRFLSTSADKSRPAEVTAGND
ncbi:hypothetical protein PIB30_036648 [Stylosanthes scabra]|uniref:PGG domain-containing protein n=1 Tax=Stylosanthes scabra TaxID=79078 RepID=A0ABU6UCW2_9FABA|nr:hypothetical protein [Stylosanthes scabra]